MQSLETYIEEVIPIHRQGLCMGIVTDVKV